MKLLHPLFMLGFMYWLYMQRSLGISILKRHGRDVSGEPSVEELVGKHRAWGWMLVIYCFAGLVAGAVLTKYLYPQITIDFGQTYGHGYIGTLSLGCILMSLVLGLSIKRVMKPKIRDRFVNFHTNIVYLIAVFAVLSLLTGVGVLVFGPGQAEAQLINIAP